MASDSYFLFMYSAKGFQRLVQQSGFTLLGFQTVPTNQGSKRSVILGSSYRVMRNLARYWPKLLEWSPKVLWLFEKK
jgi:hypothetical protein